MNFASYLIFGPSMNGGLYDYRTYTTGNKLPPENFHPKRMKRKWELLVGGSMIFTLAGPVLTLFTAIPVSFFTPLHLQKIVINTFLISALAIMIFSGIRFVQAINQRLHWPNTVNIINGARKKLAADIEKYQKSCLEYFKMLKKFDDKEFLSNFFDNKPNPLTKCREIETSVKIIKEARAFYNRLKSHYLGKSNSDNDSKIKQYAILLFGCIKSTTTHYLKDIDPQLLLTSKF